MRTPEMIPSTQQALTLPVPITLASHQQAQLFYQRHSDPQKAKQIYLNTLAVEAVHTYLDWLGIANSLQSSDSWNPIMQALSDTADLEITGQGKLECRPVLPAATTCYIPPETNENCIGYVPVLFDAALQSATLLGFIASSDVDIETAELPLVQLKPMASLFDHLQPQPSPADKRVCLGQWLKQSFPSDWQSVAALIEPKPAYSFRSLELADPEDVTGAAVRGKLLELALPPADYQNELQTRELQAAGALPLSPQTRYHIAFIVSIAPTDALQSNIWIRLCPVNGNRYLPEALEVRILDDQKTVVMEAQSRKTDMIELHFRGTLNEQFAVEVAINGASLVEEFII